MSAAVTASPPSAGAHAVNQVHDDLMKRYNPANAIERMLVTQLANTWVRLHQGLELEQRYRQANDMLDVVTRKLAEFKAITGYVRDCERAWNRAMETLLKEQRQRLKPDLPAQTTSRAHDKRPPLHTRAGHPDSPPAPAPAPTIAVAHPQRE